MNEFSARFALDRSVLSAMPSLTVLSLGVGVQSSCLALMAAVGELPKPDVAIFADVGPGNEPAPVYEYLRFLQSENVLPFPVIVARKNETGLAADILAYRDGRIRSGSTPPFKIMGDDGRQSILTRGCTRDYKVAVIRRETIRLLGCRNSGEVKKRGLLVEQWMGISVDEAHRMKMPRDEWCVNRYPLIEKQMSRADCLAWFARHDFPTPPRSACWFCPNRSNGEWRRLIETSPEDWRRAVEFDHALRARGPWRNCRSDVYLHRDLRPLDEVDLTNADQGDFWGNECEGMCGV